MTDIAYPSINVSPDSTGVLLKCPRQTQRRVPSFVVYLPSPKSKESVPVVIKAHSVKSHVWEGLRMVCKNSSCPYRATVPDEDEDLDLHGELCPDDMEEECDAGMECVESDGEDVIMDPVPGGNKKAGKGEHTVALWPFAKPLHHWTLLLKQIPHAGSSCKFLLTISRTAHPSLPAAEPCLI